MITNNTGNLCTMSDSTPLLMRILEDETSGHSSHSCTSQFRGGRRRYVECGLTVCNKCYRTYANAVRKKSNSDKSEEADNTIEMNINSIISNKLVINNYRDAEVQTDVSFPSDILCSLCASSDPSTQYSMVVDPIDSLSLPFHQLFKSKRKYSVCDIYFSGPSVRISDAVRIQGFLNEKLFIPYDSRTYVKHLVEGF